MFLPDRWETSDTLHLFTDASNLGFGGYLHNQWFSEAWPECWKKFHITIKELLPIVVALEIWAAELADIYLMFHSDNEAVVHISNQQTCKDKDIMILVRRLVVHAMSYNILFQAVHVTGLNNVLADKLYCLQVSDFLHLFPHVLQQRRVVATESLLT